MNIHAVLITLITIAIPYTVQAQDESLVFGDVKLKHIHKLDKSVNDDILVRDIVSRLKNSDLRYKILENGYIEHLRSDEKEVLEYIFRAKACFNYESNENNGYPPIPCNYRLTTASSRLEDNKFNRRVWFDNKQIMEDLMMELKKAGIEYRLPKNGDIEHQSEDKAKVQVIIDHVTKCRFYKNKSVC